MENTGSSKLDRFCREVQDAASDAWRLFDSGELRPLLVHVHIPKCAGTSFNQLLTQSFADRHVPMYSTLPGDYFPIDEIERRITAEPAAQAVSSHSFRLFPRVIGDRLPLYALFLRDPLEWQLSNITYLIENYDRLSPEHRATLPEECGSMSVKQLIGWLLERNLRENRQRTDMVRFLASPTCLEPGIEQNDSILVALAKHLLDQCFFVGIVERPSESVERLREQLAALGISLKTNPAMPELNSSRHRRGDLSWLSEADELGGLVLKGLKRDRALYAQAVHRLDKAS